MRKFLITTAILAAATGAANATTWVYSVRYVGTETVMCSGFPGCVSGTTGPITLTSGFFVSTPGPDYTGGVEIGLGEGLEGGGVSGPGVGSVLGVNQGTASFVDGQPISEDWELVAASNTGSGEDVSANDGHAYAFVTDPDYATIQDSGLAVSATWSCSGGCDAPETPLPATLPLFASGLAGLGLIGWRSKRKLTA